MARFRGTVQGNRGEASRLGSASSGMDVVAQSYSGDVRVVMMNATNREGPLDWVRIHADDHCGTGPRGIIYEGPVSELTEIIKLWRHRDQLLAVLALTEGNVKCD